MIKNSGNYCCPANVPELPNRHKTIKRSCKAIYGILNEFHFNKFQYIVMYLNEQGRARFQQHLQNILRQPCAVCGGGNWQLEDPLFELREFAGGNVPTEGVVKPLLAVTCKTCGNVVLMSAITTGVISAPQAPVANAQPAQQPVAELGGE
jgi:hypothetical protein